MRTKHQKLWTVTRGTWIIKNPPNHEGYYVCWMCHKWVHKYDMELDHIISRSRRPDLRYVLSNLAPSCHDCNTEKGSTEFVPTQYSDVKLDNIW